MQISRRNIFTTIKTEGGLLPADLLLRIAEGDPAVEGLTPEAYHLAKSERLNEAANRAWNRLKGAWEGFKAACQALPESDAGTTLTRERWLLILFQELGYGRLTTRKAYEIDGKTYPVSHEWQATPIHLVSFRQELDRRTPGARGASRVSPHSLVQELLNRGENLLWGLVSNGLVLRLLRDNVSLTRQAYVEFDLQAMMDSEAYSDFFLLFLLCHQSRVEVPEGKTPEHCWLERWYNTSLREGTRVLDRLRDGVEQAIQALGGGFLAHPANQALRQRLRSGDLTTQDYYRQVLRVVYRLLFLFVAEDRDLLHPASGERRVANGENPDALGGGTTVGHSPIAIYRRYYSTQRLRRLAERRRSARHADLYRALRLVFGKLHTGCPQLALPALGSFLFSPQSTPDLSDADIANADLLEAVRNLTFTIEGSVRRWVDYRNLGPEELGSVYESLLEMHPDVNLDAGRFTLTVAAGSERKTSGSYYTPTSLVNCLLDSALDPVIDERLALARRMASGEWRMVQEPFRTEFVRHVHQQLPGPASVAAVHESGGTGLPADQDLSQGGDVRPDQPDSARSLFNSSQHSRGMGAAGNQGVPAVSSHGPRQPSGTGDTPPAQPADRNLYGPTDATPPSGTDHPQQATPGSESEPPTPERLEQVWQRTPLAIRYSLFASQALLSLRFCDPACGSGHFLIAAAHCIAKRLAAIRAGEDEPSPLGYQHALRDVIGRCIYGVDLNPMAVELCKINLWLEALEPGKPLSFLDHHIRCGNSLLGTTPALMKRGIPDDAFKPIEGDDKKICSELKRRNKDERHGQGLLPFGQPQWLKLGNLVQSFANLTDEDDSTPEALAAKEQHFAELVRSTPYENAWLLADAWCAAFVCEKRPNSPLEITEAIFRRWEDSPFHLTPAEKDELLRLRDQYNFFHWHLAFPEVFKPKPTDQIGEDELAGWAGGFDCVLGNPPWERIKLQEKEFFAARNPEVANAPNAAARRRMIEKLKETDPPLYHAFQEALRRADGESTLVRDTGRYPLCGRGDVNTYSIFAELKRSLLNPAGRVGCIVPSGIATDDTTKFFFQDLIETGSLVSLYDFENRKGIFPAIDSRMKFCLLTMRARVEGRIANSEWRMEEAGDRSPEAGLVPADHSPLATRHSPPADFVFFALDVSDLAEPDKHFTLSAEEIALLNPNTRTCPIFRSRADAELTKAIYRRVPVLIKEARDGRPEENPWGISFLRMFDMSNDSHLFRTREQLEAEGFTLEGNIFRKRQRMASGEWRVEEYLPLWEDWMMHHFEHRYQSNGALDTTHDQHRDSAFVVQPRYWVLRHDVIEHADNSFDEGFLFGFRNRTRPTDMRTVICTVLPLSAVGNTLPILLTTKTGARGLLHAILSSFPVDYVACQKIGGLNLNFFIMKQLSVLPPTLVEPLSSVRLGIRLNCLISRSLELTYTAWDLEPFARDCGYDGPPFIWDEERRFLIRAELDAAFFHLYLPSTANGEWRMASSKEGAVVDETPEQLAELKKYFPTPRDAVAYIMETFPIVKRKDVEKYGSYRTKETILEIYDEMQRVMAENAAAVAAGRQPTARYPTRLTPPPGPPADAADNFIPMAQWDRAHWPVHIHPPRGEAAVARPVVTAPAVVAPAEQIDVDRLLAAFREVREGMSADYVVADPKANARFQDAARALGLRVEPMRLNQALLNARKAGKLKGEPSEREYRLDARYAPYVFASEWSVRHLQRELVREMNRMPSLDEILCHPGWASRFDEIAARIKPGFDPIDYRWAAFSLRKQGRARPAAFVPEMQMRRRLTLQQRLFPDIPLEPGLYLIRAAERPLYLDWAQNLAARIDCHRQVAGDHMIPPWLLEGVGAAEVLEYTWLLGYRERQLQEMRIVQVAKLEPWLNLLNVAQVA